ncbi:unnamed protein product [Spirodela intermedia]|uniref:Uncharacterized protein n=1 Tax=Spirodela intermedia TaxID=51605 RepID=A0A7I8K8A7_SPIIN|nr:unnamed protein product [Spirodela intermedia]
MKYLEKGVVQMRNSWMPKTNLILNFEDNSRKPWNRTARLRTVPHAGASLVDPLLAAPREKTHDCCRCCHHQKGGKERAGQHMVCCSGAKEERRSRPSPCLCVDFTSSHYSYCDFDISDDSLIY